MSLFSPLESPLRWVVAAASLAAAGTHLPVIADHLAEARYMGVLFIVLSSACVLIGATLISADPPAVYLLAAVTCGLAMLGYVLTRTIAFPMLADDVGNWLEPLGVASMVAEAVVVVGAGLALRGSTARSAAAVPAPAVPV